MVLGVMFVMNRPSKHNHLGLGKDWEEEARVGWLCGWGAIDGE